MWGMEVAMDLLRVNPDKIRDAEEIKRYTKELIQLIEMKAYGEPILVHFGSSEEVTGYTLVQMIETSLISAHFAENSDAAYINCFSCQRFNANKAFAFTRDFFEAKKGHLHILTRRS